MNVVVLGLNGSGKSTLVRRLMVGRQWKKVRFAGSLPTHYVSDDLTIYGNYEKTARMRHGMSVFNRDPFGFDRIMRIAAERETPGLMEGGIWKEDRLRRGYGPAFAQTATVIYLDIHADPAQRLGKNPTKEGLEKYELQSLKAYSTLVDLGASGHVIYSALGQPHNPTQLRQEAMTLVCRLLGINVPEDPVEEDYR